MIASGSVSAWITAGAPADPPALPRVTGIEIMPASAVLEGSMPPGALPRLNEVEKLTIARWIEQGACAPCNPCP